MKTTPGKILAPIAFIALIGIVSFVTIQSISAEDKRKKGETWIYIAGDSTAATYPEKRAPRAGWGQMLDPFFDEDIRVINKAKSGRSSKSFIAEGRLDDILSEIQPNDYLFIQFGHNDAKTNSPERYTEPFSTYKHYLKQYIDGARDKGAIPVLLTPVERRSFSNDGKISASHGDYPEAMKELAAEENVPLLDLTKRTTVLYNQLGPVATKHLFMWLEAGRYPYYPEGESDNVHFQEEGARKIADLVIEGIEESELAGLTKHVLSRPVVENTH